MQKLHSQLPRQRSVEVEHGIPVTAIANCGPDCRVDISDNYRRSLSRSSAFPT
jgi:hypothetical protein